MYNCQICLRTTPRRLPKKVHIFYRENGQIAREIPVCHVCKLCLEKASYEQVVAQVQTFQQRFKPAVDVQVVDPVRVELQAKAKVEVDRKQRMKPKVKKTGMVKKIKIAKSLTSLLSEGGSKGTLVKTAKTAKTVKKSKIKKES